MTVVRYLSSPGLRPYKFDYGSNCHIASAGISPFQDFHRIPSITDIKNQYLREGKINDLSFDIFKTDFQSFKEIFVAATTELSHEKLQSSNSISDNLVLNTSWLRKAGDKPISFPAANHQSLLQGIFVNLEDSKQNPISSSLIHDLFKALREFRNPALLKHCSECVDVDFFIVCILRSAAEVSERLLNNDSKYLINEIARSNNLSNLIKDKKQSEAVSALENAMRYSVV